MVVLCFDGRLFVGSLLWFAYCVCGMHVGRVHVFMCLSVCSFVCFLYVSWDLCCLFVSCFLGVCFVFVLLFVFLIVYLFVCLFFALLYESPRRKPG